MKFTPQNLTPATNWFAVFLDAEDKDSVIRIPVACWALGLEEDDEGNKQEGVIYGMVPDPDDGTLVCVWLAGQFIDYDYCEHNEVEVEVDEGVMN